MLFLSDVFRELGFALQSSHTVPLRTCVQLSSSACCTCGEKALGPASVQTYRKPSSVRREEQEFENGLAYSPGLWWSYQPQEDVHVLRDLV